MFQSIVVILAIVLYRNGGPQVSQFSYHLWIVVVDFDRRYVLNYSFDFVLNVGDYHGVVGRQVTARLLDDCRMRYVLIVTDLLDCVDNVVREFLGAVIGRRVKRRLGAVVVNRHPAAHIEQVHRHLHLIDLGINTRRFFHSVLDALDVGQLRSNVEMQQLEHVDATGFFETTNNFEHLCRRQAKLGSFAAGLLPAA